ncbi:hypothetical protein ACFS4T_04745 [Pseudomonas lini]
MNARLHNKTPTINALDSRGLPVRQVAYWRCNADDSAQARITSQDHDLAGRVIAQRDPRLFGKICEGQSDNPLQPVRQTTAGRQR